MRAITVAEPGGPERLVIVEHPDPEPGPGDLLVKVRAAGVNRADVLQRRGRYPPPPGASHVLGLEVAGLVERVGSQAVGWAPGDPVCGLLSGGGYAERAALPSRLAIRVPERLSFEEAAAIPEVWLTAFQTLFWIGRLRRGEAVLIHAGASGVGTAAIQLARDAGARVIATAGSEAKLAVCRDLGASAATDYKREPFGPAVLEATEGRGADLILDPVGAPNWGHDLDCLATDGRIVLIGTLGGSRVDGVDLAALMRKRAQVTGTTLRSRPLEYRAALTADFVAHAMPRFADGRLRPVLDSVMPWDRAADAHRRMEADLNIGKIVLTGM